MRMLEPESLALRRVPGRGRPRVRRVGAGLGSETYHVERDGQAFSMRIAARESAHCAFDAHWERRVRELAGAAGLAPDVLYADPAQGVMIARWVEGRPWTAAEAREPVRVARLAQLLRCIHALPPPRPERKVGPAEWIARYEDLHRGARRVAADFNALRSAAMRRLEEFARLPGAAAVLCHSDLHPLNVVETPSALVVLDWEYAHVTDAFWDLAGWTCVNDFDADLSGDLLRAYLGRPPLPSERARFELLKWLYDYICLIWSEVYLSRHADADGAAEFARAHLLASRLQAELGGSSVQVPAD